MTTALLTCRGCGTELDSGLLACPACRRLVHGDRLRELAATAQRFEEAGDITGALMAWREALGLLPSQADQAQTITARIASLSERMTGTPEPGHFRWARGATGIGALAFLAWKFKFVLAFALTKGKFLLLGLTKASTLFSMLLATSVYWATWGWSFAVGVVLCIYVHEMGHVAALRRFGIAASAPMFIPGLGAFVRLQQAPLSPREDARIGLAGPLWGLAAVVACYAAYVITGHELLAAVARFSAWINLFNLLPVWQLDGARAFASLTRPQRALAAVALLAAFAVSREGLLLLLAVVAGVRAAWGEAAREPDRAGLVAYVALVAALTWLLELPVPSP